MNMDVTCPKCNKPLEYNPRQLAAKRKTCPYCKHKFTVKQPVPVPSRQAVQNVQTGSPPCNDSHPDEEIATQAVQSVQNGQLEIATVQTVQASTTQQSTTTAPSTPPSSPPCNTRAVQVAMTTGKKLGSRGSPPMPLVREDLKILAGIQKRENQVTIAKKVNRSTSWVSRRIKKYQDHQLVMIDAKTGKRVVNPVFFPAIAGKNAPPIQTTTGTLPGGKYTVHVHNIYCYCEVMPSSQKVYLNHRNNFKLLNHMEGWDRLYIGDNDLGFFGAKRFANPNFMVLSTPKALFFYPWGWGNTDAEALDDAQRGAEELHDKLQSLYKIKLGFKFEIMSPSKKRQPHFSLHATNQSTLSAPSPAPVIQPAPALVVNGTAFSPDVSHPDDIEGTGLQAGKTLTQIGKDLESIPKLIDTTVSDKLQQMIQDAVAQAFKEAATAFAGTIRDAVVAGIQQGLQVPQASQPQTRPPPPGQFT